MIKVAMFVTNPCTHDARVIKEAETLASEGFSVRVYALVNTQRDAGIFEKNGYSIERVLIGGLARRFFSPLVSMIRHNRVGKDITSTTAFNEPANGERAQDIQTEDVKKSGLKATRLGRLVVQILGPARKFLIYYYFCSDASKSASLWGAQVAHCHDLSTLYAGKILKSKPSKLKVVYDSHELWIHRNRVGRKAWIEQRLDSIAERYLIRFSDRVITVCDSIGEWLSNAYPSISQPTIIRNMPYSVGAQTKGSLTIKQRLGIPEENFVLSYTGKITPGRGIELGVNALTKNANLHLVLLGYGDDNYVEFIKQEIQNLGVSAQVTFCEAVAHNEVSAFVRGADLALVCIEPVCLSYEYALPNKLFESIQAGVPILGSGLIEIKKIVDTYDVGVCFEGESDMILKLRSLTDEQLKQWRYNISTCKGELSWDQEKNKLVTLYKSLSNDLSGST